MWLKGSMIMKCRSGISLIHFHLPTFVIHHPTVVKCSGGPVSIVIGCQNHMRSISGRLLNLVVGILALLLVQLSVTYNGTERKV